MVDTATHFPLSTFSLCVSPLSSATRHIEHCARTNAVIAGQT